MTGEVPEIEVREEHDAQGNLLRRWHVYVRDDAEILHGEYELFFSNGQRAEQRFYEHGRPAGIWTTWDETGRQLYSGPSFDMSSETAEEPSAEDWDAPLVDEDAPRLPWGEYILEFGVVMALAWLPHFLTAVVSPAVLMPDVNWPSYTERDDQAFMISETYAMGMSLQVLLPFLWIIWKSDLGWRDVGIVKPKFTPFVLLGTGLGAGALLMSAVLQWLLDPPLYESIWVYPVKPFFWGVLVVSLILNSLAEEFVWRGYVLKRMTQMSGSKLFGLGVSAVLFASYHIYQGFASLLFLVPFALLFGAVVLVTKRIWPAVVAHTIYNVVMYTSLGDWLMSW